MSIDWADLRLFLDVARLGGLSAATETTGLSAATLGRRVTALEKQVGEPLFHRSHSGYALTGAGEELLRRAEDVEAAMTSLTRWLMAHHGDRIGARGNDMHSVRELVAAGGGLTVMPCFAGDVDKRLVQVAPPIPELMQEQWLVTHQDERHSREVRLVLDRIGALLKAHGPLFAGEVGNPP